MNKTFAIAAASLVSVLALTACSTGTPSSAPSSDTPTAVAPLDREAPSYSLTDNASLTEGESQFVAAIEEYDAVDYTASEEGGIATYGNIVCSDLSDGIDPMDEAAFISDELGVTAFEGGFVVGLAANSICPEFSDLVDEAANAALDGGYNNTYA